MDLSNRWVDNWLSLQMDVLRDGCVNRSANRWVLKNYSQIVFFEHIAYRWALCQTGLQICFFNRWVHRWPFLVNGLTYGSFSQMVSGRAFSIDRFADVVSDRFYWQIGSHWQMGFYLDWLSDVLRSDKNQQMWFTVCEYELSWWMCFISR